MDKFKNYYHKYKKSHFMMKITDSLFGVGVDKVLAAALPFIAVKLYGALAFGEFTYYFSIALMAALISTMGLDNGLLYFIPRVKNKYVSISFIITIFMGIILGTSITLLKPDFIKYIPIFLLMSVNALFFSLHRAKHYIRSYYLINGLLRQGISLFILFLFIYIEVKEDILIAYFLGFFVSSIILFLLNRNHFEKPQYNKELVKYSFPLMVTAGMIGVIDQIDIIMIGNVLGNEPVGLYFIASRIATLPAYLLVILNTVFASQISQLYEAGRKEELARLYIYSARILGVTSFLIISLAVVFSSSLLGFFGEEFIQAEKVLIYRGIGQFINCAVGSVWFMLSMSGHPKLNMMGTSLAAIINVILNLILIPIYGIDGAAIASMVAMSFVNILGYILVRKYFKLKVYKWF